MLVHGNARSTLRTLRGEGGVGKRRGKWAAGGGEDV